jgi:heterodisulfide reductase subunit C
MTQRDQIDMVVDTETIWWCAQCHTCVDRCPRDITPFDIIIYLQNLAVQKGLEYPKDLQIILNAVKRYGVIQPPKEIIDKEFDDYDREALGLPPYKGPSNLEAFRRALKKMMEPKE